MDSRVIIELGVVSIYLVFVIGLGFYFQKRASNTDHYFRAGGRMLWWMIGGTTFMTSFSAWTFTGAAGRAYSGGFPIFYIFFGNALGYFIGYLFLAKRFRQMRVMTPLEAVRKRFGRANEHFFMWALVPMGIVYAGIWLNSLAVFIAAFTGQSLTWIVILTGTVVMVMSLLGGAWAVIASDFIQMIVVLAISVTATLYALDIGGGPTGIIENFPKDFWTGDQYNNLWILAVWIILYSVIHKLTNTNNIYDSTRYITARDSKSASKGALLASILMIIGPFIWFIPPFVVAIELPDLAVLYPDLGKKAADASYLAFAQKFMPIGMVGILMSGLFAATMSSMDSALNRASGIFSRSLLFDFLKDKSDAYRMIVAKGITLLMGIIIILLSLFLSQMKSLSLFDIMINVASLLAIPLTLPLFFAIIIRKTPNWVPYTTVLIGLLVSYLTRYVFNAEWVINYFDMAIATGREKSDLGFVITVSGHVFITAGFYLIMSLFYNPKKDMNRMEADNFFKDLKTPVIIADNECAETDYDQYQKMGNVMLLYGGVLLILMLIPNPLIDRFAFILVASIPLFVGLLLRRYAMKLKKNL